MTKAMEEESKAIVISEILSKFLRLCGFEDAEKKNKRFSRGNQLESA